MRILLVAALTALLLCGSAAAQNLILSNSNTSITVTNFNGAVGGMQTELGGVPLGTTNNSTTGEVGTKVLFALATVTPSVTVLTTGTTTIPSGLRQATFYIATGGTDVLFSGTFTSTDSPVTFSAPGGTVLSSGSAVILSGTTRELSLQ